MTLKHARPVDGGAAGTEEGGGCASDENCSIQSYHNAIPPLSPIRRLLADLLEQAELRAELDPHAARRKRQQRLLDWLTRRLARAILREVHR